MPEKLTSAELIDSLLATWSRHNGILLYLVEQIPEEGFAARPAGSRGRSVARQLEHLDLVRRSWLHAHRTGERLKLVPLSERPTPSRSQLIDQIRESGGQVHEWLESALAGGAVPKLFGKDPVRWLGYLIAHESHHRGQIMLALKQNGMRQPEKVAVTGLWGGWIFGK